VTDDTARRERAEKFLRKNVAVTQYRAYLAGAREEAAIHADELLALRATYEGRAAFFGQAQADFMLAESAYKDEIAFLREQFGPIQLKVLALENRIREDQADFLESCEAKDQEIAALREAVREAYVDVGRAECGTLSFAFRAKRTYAMSEEAATAVRRALEEKP